MFCNTKKIIELAGNRLQVSYWFAAEAEGIFSTEINLAMPSCDGWGGRYIYRGQIPGGFGQLLELSAMTDITLDDDVLGGSVELNVSSPAELHAQPYYSVSQSEGGFRKNHAGCDTEIAMAGNSGRASGFSGNQGEGGDVGAAVERTS